MVLWFSQGWYSRAAAVECRNCPAQVVHGDDQCLHADKHQSPASAPGCWLNMEKTSSEDLPALLRYWQKLGPTATRCSTPLYTGNATHSQPPDTPRVQTTRARLGSGGSPGSPRPLGRANGARASWGASWGGRGAGGCAGELAVRLSALWKRWSLDPSPISPPLPPRRTTRWGLVSTAAPASTSRAVSGWGTWLPPAARRCSPARPPRFAARLHCPVLRLHRRLYQTLHTHLPAGRCCCRPGRGGGAQVGRGGRLALLHPLCRL